MEARFSNCVALGVEDMAEAAAFYSQELGFKISQETDEWIELDAGALKIYLCQDDARVPVFDLVVDDPATAWEELHEKGFRKVDLGAPGNEIYVRDPFGYLYVLSQANTGTTKNA